MTALTRNLVPHISLATHVQYKWTPAYYTYIYICVCVVYICIYTYLCVCVCVWVCVGVDVHIIEYTRRHRCGDMGSVTRVSIGACGSHMYVSMYIL